MLKDFFRTFVVHAQVFLRRRQMGDKYQTLLFWGALSVFVFFQTGMVVHIYSGRSLPPEADDVYTYILKAVEFRDCFIQNCRALETLRSQVSVPSFDLSPHGTSMSRDRAAHRTLLVYHPLHSVLLDSIQATGVTWEQAYYILAVLGSVFLALAIALWLRYLFGPAIAGIAMLLLANYTLQSQGVTFIVPSNLDLAFFLLLWATLLRPEKKGSEWFLLLGAIVMVTMHTIGRLYVIVLAYLYWSAHRGSLTPTKKISIASALWVTLAAFLLPLFVNRPVLGPFPQAFPQLYPRNAELYISELTADLGQIQVSFMVLGNTFALVAILLIGLLSGSKVNFQGLLILVVCAIMSVIPSDPGYPAEIFSRIWDPLLLVIVGYVALGYWSLFSGIAEFLMRFKTTRVSGRQRLAFVGIAGLVVLIAANLYYMLQTEIRYRQDYGKYVIMREDYWFNQKQPEYLAAQSQACGDVVYFSEAARDYFLVHGALSCGAIDYASVVNSPEEQHWIADNPDLRFAVLFNPVVQLPSAENGGIAISLEEKLNVSTMDDSAITQNIMVLLENEGAGDATIVAKVKGKPIANFVIGTGQHWLEISTEGSSRLIINSEGKRDRIIVRGIKLKNDTSGLVWPWNSNLMLSTIAINTQQEPSITFQKQDIENLLSSSRQYDLTVLMDDGDTVVIGIRRTVTIP